MKKMLNRPFPALSTASIGLGRFSQSTPLVPECCGGCGRNIQQQKSWWAYRFRRLGLNMLLICCDPANTARTICPASSSAGSWSKVERRMRVVSMIHLVHLASAAMIQATVALQEARRSQKRCPRRRNRRRSPRRQKHPQRKRRRPRHRLRRSQEQQHGAWQVWRMQRPRRS